LSIPKGNVPNHCHRHLLSILQLANARERKPHSRHFNASCIMHVSSWSFCRSSLTWWLQRSSDAQMVISAVVSSALGPTLTTT
jgi:hypothetical protein